MRIIFMGTPEFAVPSLKILSSNDYEPIAVVTGQDKRRGRGRKVSVTPVKQAAADLGIGTILQPASVKSEEFAEEIASLEPDLIVVVAFRILPPVIFEAAKLGSFNLHGSLLPSYRGAAPIHHAVLNGDESTGVTTFFLQQKVDTGDVILRREMPIGINDTTGDVHDRMMYLGAEAVLETVRRINDGDVRTLPQDDAIATPAPKVFRRDGFIDWSLPAQKVHNHIRGYSPVPGAWTQLDGQNLRLFRTRVISAVDLSGMVLSATDPSAVDLPETIGPGIVSVAKDDSFVVGCAVGSGAIAIDELQLEGRQKMATRSFLNGVRVSVGHQFPLEQMLD